MVNSKYRDAYVVIDLLESNAHPYFGDKVTFYYDDACINGKIVGHVSQYLEDVLSVSETINKLRMDGIIPVNVLQEKASFVTIGVLQSAGIDEGVIVSVLDNLAVVYMGVIEITDDLEIADAENTYFDLLQEAIRYTLTDKGRALLEEMETNQEEAVCPVEREENSTMNNLLGNLGFGKLQDYRFKLSMNGIAVEQRSGRYVVYNKDNNEFVDVTDTLFDLKDALFLLPAVEVSAGDTVIHEGKPYYIVEATNEIKAVSYEDCTQTVLIPKSTMFGIKYFNKVFSIFGDNFASAGDLFANPMTLMALMNGNNGDLSQLMLLNALNNGDLGNNPMVLAMLMKGDKGNGDLSSIALMSLFNNGTNPFSPKKTKTSKSKNEND